MLELQRIRHCAALALGFVAWLAAGVVLVAGSAPAQVRVTSLDGDLSAGGRNLALHSEVADGQTVELSQNAHGSFLIADNALVRLCGGASSSFTGAKGRNPARVELRQGALSATLAAKPGQVPLEIDTPTARVEVLGSAVHVAVSPDGATTTVSSLEGRMRVSRRVGSGTRIIATDQRVAVTRGRALGKSSRFDPNELASSSCLRSGIHRSSAAAASSLMLVTAAPHVSADAEDAHEFTSDLAQIVAADFPEDGIPLDEASSPSALITELSKAGLDEEVCDPITCNPVYELPAPPFCDISPITGCIPRFP